MYVRCTSRHIVSPKILGGEFRWRVVSQRVWRSWNERYHFFLKLILFCGSRLICWFWILFGFGINPLDFKPNHHLKNFLMSSKTIGFNLPKLNIFHHMTTIKTYNHLRNVIFGFSNLIWDTNTWNFIINLKIMRWQFMNGFTCNKPIQRSYFKIL